MSNSAGDYHSRRGDSNSPAELIPASRPRLNTESYPGSIRTVATGYRGQYVCSLSSLAAIPQLPPEEYHLVRTDYRLGPHDPLLYPQIWSPTAPHLAWVERHELHRELHQRDIVAYVFQYHDWNPTVAMPNYGRVSGDLLCRLEMSFHDIYAKAIPFLKSARTRLLVPTTMVTECTRLLSDLRVLTSTFQDSAVMVTRIQRGIAELRAFRLFRLDVQHHVGDPLFVSDRVYNYVGVFTSDRAMADLLHRLGVPVWLIVTGLPRGLHAQPPIPFSQSVEIKPLNQLDEYHTDWAGQRQRNRDVSPPSYTAASEPDPRAIPAARSSRRRSRSPSRVRVSSVEQSSRTPMSRRSRSPQAPSSSRGQPSAISVVPRYILHEQPRQRDTSRRRHPDAPEAWHPRCWTTDPGHEAAQGFQLPDWVPKLSPWLLDVAGSVDRSITREWRLCAADCLNPVPQDVFDRPLEYAMPPMHLLLKHEKRFAYVISAWAALRDFWLNRLSNEGYCGLSATVWRKILDDKYNISKELAAWIAQNASPASSHPSGAAVRDPEAPNPQHRLARPQLTELVRESELDISRIPENDSSQYTLLGQVGEDLVVATSRDSIEPQNWREGLSFLEIYYESSARCMSLIGLNDVARIRDHNLRWDEYWDYEGKRVLLFDRRSGVPHEHDVPHDCELLLNDRCVTWHLSRDDHEGLGRASRAVWKANEPLVTDGTGELLHDVVCKALRNLEHASDTRPIPTASDGPAQGDYSRGNPLLKSHPAAPPADPVYGYHAQLPNGQHAKQFVIRQQVLRRDDLTRTDIRAFLIWEIAEAEFRFQLRRTDTYVLKSLGLWSSDVEEKRITLMTKVWGGADGFVPSGAVSPAHSDADPHKRLAAIYSFWNLVRAWPRCREITNLAHYTAREGLSLERLLQVERDVWKFYAQTFFDYFGILPSLPRCMPPNPFLTV